MTSAIGEIKIGEIFDAIQSTGHWQNFSQVKVSAYTCTVRTVSLNQELLRKSLTCTCTYNKSAGVCVYHKYNNSESSVYKISYRILPILVVTTDFCWSSTASLYNPIGKLGIYYYKNARTWQKIRNNSGKITIIAAAAGQVVIVYINLTHEDTDCTQYSRLVLRMREYRYLQPQRSQII